MSDSATRTLECFFLQNIINHLPHTPIRRECLIQNAKYLRLLTGRLDGIGPAMALGTGSVRKLRKRMGRRMQAIGQQARKVRALTDQCFKEFLRSQRGSLTNSEYREWKAKFDSGMKAKIDEALVQLTENVTKNLAEGQAKRRARIRSSK